MSPISPRSLFLGCALALAGFVSPCATAQEPDLPPPVAETSDAQPVDDLRPMLSIELHALVERMGSMALPATAATREEADAGDDRSLVQDDLRTLHLLRFLQDMTGELVNFPMASGGAHTWQPEHLTTIVSARADMESLLEPLTLDACRALLIQQGYELWRETLDDGNKVIHVRRRAQSRSSLLLEAPAETVRAIETVAEDLFGSKDHIFATPPNADELSTLIVGGQTLALERLHEALEQIRPEATPEQQREQLAGALWHSSGDSDRPLAPVILADSLRTEPYGPREVIRLPAGFGGTAREIEGLLVRRGFLLVRTGPPENARVEVRRNEVPAATMICYRPFDLLKHYEPELSTETREYPSAAGDPYFWPDATIDLIGGLSGTGQGRRRVPPVDFSLLDKIFAANFLESHLNTSLDGLPIWEIRTLEGHSAPTLGMSPERFVPPATLISHAPAETHTALLELLTEQLRTDELRVIGTPETPPVVFGGAAKLLGAVAESLSHGGSSDSIRNSLLNAGIPLGPRMSEIASSPPADEGIVASSAAAEEPDPSDETLVSLADADPETTTDPAIREKVYYVPFEELKQVFEAADRGIFLPYDEFLELWRKAEGRGPDVVEAPPTPTVIRGGTYRGTVGGGSARFSARYSVEALAAGWTETPFALGSIALESARVLENEAESADALFVTKNGTYTLFLPRPGTYEVELVFSVPVVEQPGRKSLRFAIPSVAVSQLDLTIPEEELRVAVEPILAATDTTNLVGATEVHAFLGDSGFVSIAWMPPAGRAADGGAIVSAHQEALAALDERILRLASRVHFAVLRGEVDTFRIALPADMELIAVNGENLKEWRPEEGVLTVALHAAVKKSYTLDLEFERILDGTPPTIAIPFPRAENVQRESGTVVFEHDPALRVRVAARERLSQLDPEEIPEHLRAQGRTGYSYLETPVSLALEVEKIEPQVRSETVSVITLGTNEDRWDGWVDATITRAGLFQLSLQIPTGWEVESIGDPSVVETFQVTDGEAGRTVQVSLRSRAFGTFRLPFRFAREGSARAGNQTITAPVVVGSEQDRGLLGITAPRAFEVTTNTTTELTDTDVEELFRTGILGQLRTDTAIPRAFRYRKHPATAELTLTERRTEIDLLAQHLLDVGDGEVQIAHLLDYEILYAAVDTLRFRAPSSLDDSLSVEVKQKTQVRKVGTEGGITTWEVGLQPPALGNLTLTIHHAIALPELVAGTPRAIEIPLVEAVGTRGTEGFVAIRKEGTLEVGARVDGMEGIDAGELPDKLRRGRIASAYRYFTTTPTIALDLTRYDHETLATAVVSLMHLRSLVSKSDGSVLTEMVLWMQNSDRQFLELELPPGSKIDALAVNGRSQSAKKRTEGGETLIDIPRSVGAAGTFPVVVRYQHAGGGGEMGSGGVIEYETPRILAGIPVHEIELDLYLPPEFQYLGWKGNLHRRAASTPGSWERFKSLLGLTTAPRNTASAGSSIERTRADAGAIQFPDLPTDGRVHERFQTLSPTGTLRMRYYGKNFFSFLDFILFVGAALATWVVVERRAKSKTNAALVLLFFALTYLWFSEGPARSFASSVFGGVVIICGFLVLRTGRGHWKMLRAERFALAPDPFLEDADKAPKEKKKRTKKSKKKDEKGDTDAKAPAPEAEKKPPATSDSDGDGDDAPKEGS